MNVNHAIELLKHIEILLKCMHDSVQSVSSTLTCYFVDIVDIVRFCLGGVGDRSRFGFISILVCFCV